MELVVNNDKKIGRNDLCPCGSGRKYKRCCLEKNQQTKYDPRTFDPMKFRREMEQSLSQIRGIAENKNLSIEDLNHHFVGRSMDDIGAEFNSVTGENPKRKAEEILGDALDEPNCAKGVKLAYKALSIYPHLADAWIKIGEHAGPTAKEILPYFEKAVEAGEKDLGETFFKQNIGFFWGLIESRPYMRAKAFLAQVLWDLGREDEAIQNYKDCLKLNPNDNQGLRYELISWLLAKDRIDEIEPILKQYKNDCGAMWSFNKALYLFKKFGPDSKKASKQLVAAIVDNAYVPKYLSGKKKLPAHSPDSYALGSLEEAIAYAEDAIIAWKRTSGALEWLSRFA